MDSVLARRRPKLLLVILHFSSACCVVINRLPCEQDDRVNFTFEHDLLRNSIVIDLASPTDDLQHEVTVLEFLFVQPCLQLGTGKHFSFSLEDAERCVWKRVDANGTAVLGTLMVHTSKTSDDCKSSNATALKCFEIQLASEEQLPSATMPVISSQLSAVNYFSYSTPPTPCTSCDVDTPDLEIEPEIRLVVLKEPNYIGDYMEIIIRQDFPSSVIVIRLEACTVVPVFKDEPVVNASFQIVEQAKEVAVLAFLSERGQRLSFSMPRTGYYNVRVTAVVQVEVVGFGGGRRNTRDITFELQTMTVSEMHLTTFSYVFQRPLTFLEVSKNKLPLSVATAQAAGVSSLRDVSLTPVTTTHPSVSRIHVEIKSGEALGLEGKGANFIEALARYNHGLPAVRIEGFNDALDQASTSSPPSQASEPPNGTINDADVDGQDRGENVEIDDDVPQSTPVATPMPHGKTTNASYLGPHLGHAQDTSSGSESVRLYWVLQFLTFANVAIQTLSPCTFW